MRLLFDSHVLLAVVRNDVAAKLGGAIELLLASQSNDKIVSVASLWEIAIKHRLSKLHFALPIEDFPQYFGSLGFDLLAVDHRHAVERLKDEPGTRDPFDRMLLAQCQVEDLRLVTIDRTLVSHPLAWRL
jgi:PIN domain nuclease of toxin-antitoxin system